MQQIIEGKGTLRSVDVPRVTFAVQYYFDIHTDVIDRPGFPPLAGRSSGLGRVEATSAEVIPVGLYDLATEDGQSIRLKNLGFSDWHILGSGGR